MSRDRRPLGALLAANVVSITGNALTMIGVPWFVLETTGSPTRMGLVAFCGLLPVVVSAVAGGPLIDRIGRRRTSVASDAVCALAVAAIPLLHFAGLLQFWLLCTLMAVTGLFHAPGETSRSSIMPALAKEAGTTISRAASFYDGASRGARMLGAAFGGILIAVFGAETVLLIDAATFAVSALLIAYGLRGLSSAGPVEDAAPVSLRSYRSELREGYSFVLRNRLLLAVTLMVMVTNGLDQSWSTVLLPVHAKENLGGSTQLGLLFGLFGAGALISTLIYAAWGDRLPRWPVFTIAFLICSVPRMVVAAFSDSFTALAVTIAVGGLAAGVLNPILSTVFYEQVPDALRSRVLSVTTAGVLMASPLGGLAAGFLVGQTGLTTALLCVGSVYLLATLSPLVFPCWRGMDAPQDKALSSPEPSHPTPVPSANSARPAES